LGARATSQPIPADTRPVVLDLDNTLIRTNVLHELTLAYLKGNPLRAFQLALWLTRGKAYLKDQLSRRVTLDTDLLPVNEEVVAYAREQKALGRRIILATAAESLIARRIARRFDFITDVVGTENGVNLRGEAKALKLAAMFPDGFLYVGDSAPDLHVWAVSKSAVVVSESRRFARKVGRIATVERHVRTGDAGRAMLKLMRPHQWAKNALVFAPLVLDGQAANPASWLVAGIAFLALSLLASATYGINDLFDLQDDRAHWSKKHRPIASGALPISRAMVLAGALLLAAFALAALGNALSFTLILLYGVLTISYSLALKRQPVTDAFVLAALFTLRIGIGIAAVGATPSPWLLVFSMFLFGSLSFAKRYTEIARMKDNGRMTVAGRGYIAGDAALVLAMGLASGIGAIIIMVLYLIEDAFAAGFYDQPAFLWSFPAILFLWIGRVWLLCHRGELNDDPVAFAIRDRTSIVMGAGMGLMFVGAVTGLSF
jgi:4-hydroxybenzoate polyprenyltransferase/phosphoserine phosphatase